MKIIETITAESFAPYGKVLQFSGEKPDTCFEIIVTEEKSPWRLAMFRVKNTECLRLECHPTSLESFEPVQVFYWQRHPKPRTITMHFYSIARYVYIKVFGTIWSLCLPKPL